MSLSDFAIATKRKKSQISTICKMRIDCGGIIPEKIGNRKVVNTKDYPVRKFALNCEKDMTPLGAHTLDYDVKKTSDGYSVTVIFSKRQEDAGALAVLVGARSVIEKITNKGRAHHTAMEVLDDGIKEYSSRLIENDDM
ncbi:MAG: hypothetical protein JKY23_06555 [Nitrospinaceae bacterium]|nr:hypothetical protein [Nitrospinaceae bacterium]